MEQKVLLGLKKLEAVTVMQAIEIWFGGVNRTAYRVMDKLQDQGLIRKKNYPGDKRVKCLLLTSKGARAVQADETSTTPSNLAWVISRNQVFVEILKIGIPENCIKHRLEVCDKYEIDPKKTIIAWAIEGTPKKLAFYVSPVSRYYQRMYDSATQPGCIDAKFTTHILIAPSAEKKKANIRRYVNKDPNRGLNIWTVEDIPILLPILMETKPPSVVGSELLSLTGGKGVMEQSPIGSPTSHIFKRKTSVFFGDLRTNDVSQAAGVQQLTGEKLKYCNVIGTTFLVRDKSQARDWCRLFGHGLKIWYIDPQGGFYEGRNGKLKTLREPNPLAMQSMVMSK